MLDSMSLGMARSDLFKRVVMAVVLAPLGFAAIWYGGWALIIAAVACAITMAWEWLRLMKIESQPVQLVFYGSAIAICAIAARIPDLLFIAAGVALILLSAIHFGLKRKNLVWFLAGFVYAGLAPAALIFVRTELEQGLLIACAVLLNVWVSDIAAYFAGRGFGGPLLSPRDSPNKTWSGTAGALICTALVGATFSGFRGTDLSLWVSLSLLVSLAAQTGDLWESQVKRRFGVKDASGLIPGHGGALDRLDSLAIAILFAALVFSGFPQLADLL